MPGLSFLSKKGFHTSNLKNLERVWAAEKKADEEKAKLAEYQKQINEERQIQELRQLQVASGQVVKTVDTTLDWMYEGPSAGIQAQQSSEEYLLGKIYKPQENKTLEDGMLGMIDNRNDISSSQWMKKVSSKNDSFTRVHEDPILLIKQEEKKAMESVINNPLKMDRIRQRISQELLQRGDEKEPQEKKSKKEHRKEEKKEKKRLKKEAKDKINKKDHNNNSKGKNGDRNRRHGDNDNDDDSNSVPDRKRRRRDEEDQENRRNKQLNRSRSRSRSSGSSSDSTDSKPSRSEDEDDRGDGGRARYGLTKRKQGDDSRSDDRRATGSKSLGPSEQLLQQRQQQQREKEEAIRRSLKDRRDVKQISEEEKARRLREMQEDAEKVDRTRAQRLGHRSDKEDDGSNERKRSNNASFLGDMRTEAYVQSYERGIKDRLDQNKHYAQRSIDLNSDGFMRR